MGINGAGVEASIAKWNKAVKAGKDADFGRETLGGLKADAQMRILREDGKPIGNLYGAGSVVGGANGADALTTLKNTWVIGSGYVAAESALKQLK